MARESKHHLYKRKVDRGGYIEVLYYVRFVDWKAKRRVFPAGSNYGVARQLRDELLARNVLRYDFDKWQEGKASFPFSEWLEKCLEMKAHKRAIRNYRMAAPKLVEFFGKEPIEAIDADAVQEFKTWRYRQKTQYGAAPKPATVNRELALLKIALRQAFKLGKLERVPLIELDSENNKRDRIASEVEFQAICENVPEFARDVIIILYEQGMRLSEGVGLLRSNVKLDEGIIRLEGDQTKNGKPREIPMTQVTKDILIKAMTRKVRNVNARVFLDPDGETLTRFQVYAYFKRACQKAKVSGLTIHDLRATFSTRKTITEGHDRKLIMALIGDSSDVFNRYVRPSMDDLRRVMDQ